MQNLSDKYIQGDCMDYLPDYPDNYFSLCICDPPYGIGKDGQVKTTGGHGGRKEHKKKEWDKCIPDKEYFDQLFRVSKNQIIWGANYYPQYLKGSMGWVFWDKGQDINQSDGELAYTSFQCKFRRVTINRVELLKDGTIHPTQKPIKLYKWLLKNYAKQGDLILDSHVGSASSLIAFIQEGFDFIGFEKDPDYYKESYQRVIQETSQTKLTDFCE